MTSISKLFETETAHIVRHAVSERCKFNVHGHSYKWEVSIVGEVDTANGMLLDFKQLKPIADFIDQFDHAMIFWSKEDLEIISFFTEHFKRVVIMNKNTTAESMARLVHKFTSDWLKANFKDKEVDYVRVWETRKGSAIARESDSDDILVGSTIND